LDNWYKTGADITNYGRQALLSKTADMTNYDEVGTCAGKADWKSSRLKFGSAMAPPARQMMECTVRRDFFSKSANQFSTLPYITHPYTGYIQDKYSA